MVELSELSDYAWEEYQMKEQRKWRDFPGFSVLCHPRTGKWVAVLMRQWDVELGTELQRCDLRCGPLEGLLRQKPWLSAPLRMRPPSWVGVSFTEETEPETVFHLLDLAVAEGEEDGVTLVLESPAPAESPWHDTPLPLPGETAAPRQLSLPLERKTPAPKERRAPDRERKRRSDFDIRLDSSYSVDVSFSLDFSLSPGAMRRAGAKSEEASLPEPLRQAMRISEDGRRTEAQRARDFCRQALFLEDYEDDFPWTGDFVRYYPSYRDLSARQLRGYFGWRTAARKGRWGPIPSSAAYIYIYELLNGVGADGPEDALDKLRAFEAGFLDGGFGNEGMRLNLRHWMLDLAVYRALPPETALACMEPEQAAWEAALAALLESERAGDDEIFEALCLLSGKGPEASPVLKEPARGRALFAGVWRLAAGEYREGSRDLFTLCFGSRQNRAWQPFANAVVWRRDPPKEADCLLSPVRHYVCQNGVWRVSFYDRLFCSRRLLQELLRETDRLLRLGLHTGRPLKQRPGLEWLAPLADRVLAAEAEARREAARPRLRLDLSDLDRIRADAAVTRDSLLVEEAAEQGSGIKDQGSGDGGGSEFRVQGSAPPVGGGVPDAPPVAACTRRSGEHCSPWGPRSDEATGNRQQAAGQGSGIKDQGSGGAGTDCHDQSADWSRNDRIGSVSACRDGSQPSAVPRAGESPVTGQESPGDGGPDSLTALDETQLAALRALLAGEDPGPMLRARRVMPSLLADAVNEALLDEFGDTVLDCDGDRLSLVEDYAAELSRLLEVNEA